MNKTVFVFPGQGSQYEEMWKNYYYDNEIVSEIFEQASDLTGVNIKKICFETGMEELKQTKNTQLAIFTSSYAAFKVFMKEGLQPSFMAGHSLGEITALTCAGAISFKDAVRLVKARGEIMQKVGENTKGTMAAIKGVHVEKVKELCDKYSKNNNIVNISNYNSQSQIVISGNEEAVELIGEDIKKTNGKFIKLKVSGAFHSPLMYDASEEFKKELEKYEYYDLKYPVISNVTAKPYKDSKEIINMLSKQLVSPVLWSSTVDYLIENDVDCAVELGPNNVLSKIIKRSTDKIKVFSYDNSEDMINLSDLILHSTGRFIRIREEQDELKENIKNKAKYYYAQNSNQKYQDTTAVTLCLANAICTPNKNNNKDEYKDGVIEPYKKIRNLQSIIERQDRNPNDIEIDESFNMLFSVFNAKKVPIEEQRTRIKDICNKLNL